MRLAAHKKAGYFPLPPSIVEILKTYIRPAMLDIANLGGYQILDPCCGAGKALAGLAESIPGCTSYGNELDTERAAQSEKRLNIVTCGPIEFLRVGGQFGLCLLNPPYTEGETDRQEIEFLNLATPCIAPRGLLIYVVPEKIATRGAVLQDLLNDYKDVEIRRFPPKEYERFNQVVVFGIKREKRQEQGYFEVREFKRRLKDRGIEDLTPDTLSFLIPTSPEIERFEAAVPNIALAMEEAETSGALSTDKWRMVMTGGARGIGRFQPLMQMKPGHIALLTAAGFANGMRLDDDRLVKGYVERYIEKETEQRGDATIVIEKQRQAAVLVTLNLQTCEVRRYDSRKKEEYETFLTENVDTLTRGIQDQYEPLYKMGLNGWKDLIPTIRAPSKLPGHEGNGLLAAQQHVVAALGQRLRTEKAVGIVGECGVGKTLVSIALKTLINAYGLQASPTKKVKVVVLCPNHLPPKWKREVEKSAREYGAKVIICRSVSDVDRAMNMDGLTFLILSEQNAKHTSRWEPRYVVRRKLIVRTEQYWEEERRESAYAKEGYYMAEVQKTRRVKEIVGFVACPDCGEFYEHEERLVRVDEDGRSVLFEELNKKPKCKCGSAMWTYVPYATVQRYALATYLNRHYAGKYHLIVDECFPAGTLVDTPEGPRPIEAIRAGDMVYSYRDSEVVECPVEKTICNLLVGNLVEVIHEQGSFICTPNHKVWVGDRYVPAERLEGLHLTARCYDGHSEPRLENSNRGGWENPRCPTAEKQGSKEGKDVGGFRMDSLALPESGCAGQLGPSSYNRQSCSRSAVITVRPVKTQDNVVYNLEVADTHNYFAEGVLVSNCHQYKSATTARAQAFQTIAATAISMIVMTGTLYGGRAPSLFYLLHRTLNPFRELYAFDEAKKFTEHYGLIETTRTKTTSLEKWHSVHGYTKTSKSTRVLPGAHPGMVALLLPHFVFLNLSDLGVELPPYTEKRLPVEISDGLAEGYSVIEDFGEEAKKKAARGDMSYLAAYLQASLGWLDCPEMEKLETRDEVFEVPGIDPSEDGLYPKDQKLIELIESEIAQERRVGVYFQQVNKRDPMPRIQKVLQERGIDARILRQKVKPEKREGWYRKAIAGGMQVLLCQGNLVGMGLDLVELPTLVEFQHEYSLYNLRQRDRRSWRLGQTEPVKIIFLYYEGTMQEDALRLVAEKLRAAQMLDGETIEGLSSFGQIASIQSELMAAVVGDIPPREWAMGAVEILPIPEKKMVVRAAVELNEAGGVKSCSVALVPAEAERKPFVVDEYSQMGLGI